MVDMLDTNDLSLRRARLDIPFYAEEEAGSRNGALAESLGFLPDLTQIVECLRNVHKRVFININQAL